MKTKRHAVITLLLGVTCAINGAALAPPAPIFPLDGAVLTQSIPHFKWQRSNDLKPESVSDCEIQIATDEKGENVVDRDRIAGVIGWYVPDRELPPGNYTWRVAAVDTQGRLGAWSPARRFAVRRPDRGFSSNSASDCRGGETDSRGGEVRTRQLPA